MNQYENQHKKQYYESIRKIITLNHQHEESMRKSKQEFNTQNKYGISTKHRYENQYEKSIRASMRKRNTSKQYEQ